MTDCGNTGEMGFAIEFSGPRTPLSATPTLQPHTVRRTTSLDLIRTEFLGPVSVDARGRDVAADAEGTPHEQAFARLDIDMESVDCIATVRAHGTQSPTPEQLALLSGSNPSHGYRKQLGQAVSDHVARTTLWHLVLDDLPGITLVSGVAPQHAEALAGGGPITEMTIAAADQMAEFMADICAGWAREATMLREFNSADGLPIACGPIAPNIETPAGVWHDMPQLVAHSVRRQRRIDVTVTPQAWVFETHFRDSAVNEIGEHRCVHEYLLRGSADPASGAVRELECRALTLPWQECPGAVASAQRVVGQRLTDIRSMVRTDFHGASTCTHLNDTIRSLGDIPSLAEAAGDVVLRAGV